MPFVIQELDTDTFTGTENPLATPWETGDGNGFRKDSGEAGPSTSFTNDTSQWLVSERNYPDDQWAECTLDNEGSSGDGAGPAVRCSVDPGATYLIGFWGFNPTAWVSSYDAGFTAQSVTQNAAGTTGDILRIEIQGDTWILYLNGDLIESQSGFTAVTTGQPGMYGARDITADISMASWRAGDFIQDPSQGINIWNNIDPAPTGGTTADFARDGEDIVPNAAIHFLSNGIAYDSVWAPAKMGIGFSDGTDDRWIGFGSQNGIANTDTHCRNDAGGCMGILEHASSTVNGECSHNSWIAGGQRVDVDNAFTQAHLVGSMFFDVDFAKVMTATLVTVDTAVNIDPGAPWKCAIVISCPDLGSDAATDTQGVFSFGVFDKTNVAGFMWGEFSGVSVGVPDKHFSTVYVGGKVDTVDGTIDWGIEAALGAGTSLDLTPKIASPAASTAVYVLFLGWNSGESVKVHEWAMPNTTTGVITETGVGFRGQAMINISGGCNGLDTAHADDEAGAFGFGLGTDSFGSTHSVAIEDASTTTDTQSLVEPFFNSLAYDDGLFTPNGWSSRFNGFTDDGWKHDVELTNPNFAASQIALIFGANPILQQLFYNRDELPIYRM